MQSFFCLLGFSMCIVVKNSNAQIRYVSPFLFLKLALDVHVSIVDTFLIKDLPWNAAWKKYQFWNDQRLSTFLCIKVSQKSKKQTMKGYLSQIVGTVRLDRTRSTILGTFLSNMHKSFIGYISLNQFTDILQNKTGFTTKRRFKLFRLDKGIKSGTT